MKSLHLDLLLLFTYTISNTIYYIWPLIYPYLTSYLKHSNPATTMKEMFCATLGLFIGVTAGNIILPKLYFFFGIKKTMQIGGFLNLLNCFFYFYFSNRFFVVLNIIFSGLIYQFCIISVNYFLSEKYEDGYFYCNYVFVGQNIANIFWPFIAVLIINPDNVGMNLEIYENGEIINYFPWSISKNFPFLISTIGIVNFLIIMVSTFFLKDPENIKGVFVQYIIALFTNNKRALEEISKNFKETNISEKSIHYSQNSFHEKKKNLKNSQNSDSIKIQNSEILLKTSKSELSHFEAEKKAKKIMKSPLFILFIIILGIRQSPLSYILDNYKLISFNVVKNDKLISLALSISAFSSILGQISISPIWKKLGFFKTHFFLSFFVIVGHLVYLFKSVDSSFFMFWIISFMRIFLQMVYGANYLTKFAIFEPKVAIFISKSLDNNYLVGAVFMVGMNYLFFTEDDIVTIFWIFLGFNILGLVLFLRYFRGFKEHFENL